MAGRADARAPAREAEIQAELRRRREAVTAAEVAAQRVRDQAAETAAELGEVRERLGHEAELEAADEPGAARRRGARDAARRGWSGWRAGASSSGRSTRWRRTSTPRRSSTSRSSSASAPTSRPRCASCAGSSARPTARSARPSRRRSPRPRRTSRSSCRTSSRAARARCAWSPTSARRARCSAASRCRRRGRTHDEAREAAADAEAEADADESGDAAEELLGVEIEITPAGKSTKRLSLLSGGEKSMTALAFLFAVFLARPCPFYILDEVEAALDDLNLDRFLALLRRYAERAQFIVITHQKRTMEAADCAVRRLDGRRRRLEGALAPPRRPRRASRRRWTTPRGRLRPRCGAGAGIVAAPVARDWSDLLVTGAPADARRCGRRGRGGQRRRGFFRRLRESMSKTRAALGEEIQATLFGTLDERDLGTPRGGADHGRRGRATTASVVATLEPRRGAASSRAARRSASG